MAQNPRPLTNDTDVVEPFTEDWTTNDDGAVVQAARAGIDLAQAEAVRRGLPV